MTKRRTLWSQYMVILILSILIPVSPWPTVPETDKDKKPGEAGKDARNLELNLRRTIARLRNADADTSSIEPAPIWERPHEAEKDSRNLELNLRWIIARLRNADKRKPAAVGVYADDTTTNKGNNGYGLTNYLRRCRLVA